MRRRRRSRRRRMGRRNGRKRRRTRKRGRERGRRGKKEHYTINCQLALGRKVYPTLF